MYRVSTKKVALNGLMMALVFLATRFTSIPGPVGYFNIGDVVIMIAAVLLGKNSGFLAGSVGSALADLYSGYGIFAPVTFVVKGLEGYITGMIASPREGKKPGEFVKIAAVVSGAVMMIAGYFFAELYILSIFDKTFGYAAAIKDLVPNLVQGGVSTVIGYILSTLLDRSNIRRYI